MSDELTEKRAIVEPGRTPPEESGDASKTAGADQLQDHVTKRLSDEAEDSIDANRNS